jgi:zinc finger protein
LYPEAAVKIDAIIDKILLMIAGKSFPFQFILNDPAGNSYIQNPLAPMHDTSLKVEKYVRTKE